MPAPHLSEQGEADRLSGAGRERRPGERYNPPATKWPHSGRCANCERERDDLFWHEQDAVYYCGDVTRCELRRGIIDARQEPAA
jgi:hypothetical protein